MVWWLYLYLIEDAGKNTLECSSWYKHTADTEENEEPSNSYEENRVCNLEEI